MRTRRLPINCSPGAAAARQTLKRFSFPVRPVFRIGTAGQPRAELAAGGEHLVVAHHAGTPHGTELRSRRPFGPEIGLSKSGLVIGRPSLLAWEVVCWHRGTTSHYLELETKWDGSWRLQRQTGWPARNSVPWLADAGDGAGDPAVRSTVAFCRWPPASSFWPGVVERAAGFLRCTISARGPERRPWRCWSRERPGPGGLESGPGGSAALVLTAD